MSKDLEFRYFGGEDINSGCMTDMHPIVIRMMIENMDCNGCPLKKECEEKITKDDETPGYATTEECLGMWKSLDSVFFKKTKWITL